MKTRTLLGLLTGGTLAMAWTAVADPSASCPSEAPALDEVGSAFDAPVCFGDVGLYATYRDLDWNGDGIRDLLIGPDGYARIPRTDQSLEIWLGTPGWGPGAEPIVVQDNSGGVYANEVATTVVGDTDGDGRDEIASGRNAYTDHDPTPGTSSLWGADGLIATWGTGSFLPPVVPEGVGDVNDDGADDAPLGSNLLAGQVGIGWGPGNPEIPTPDIAFLLPVGDVDGDGVDDVGAKWWEWDQIRWARGGAGGLMEGPPIDRDGFPYPVGDTNGDGADDLVVWVQATSDRAPSVTLHLGGPEGPDPLGLPIIPDHFGMSPVSVRGGDVNGDGYGDVLLARDGDWPAATQNLLFLGGPAGLAPTPTWVGTGRMSLVGDLNADGRDDVIVEGPTSLVYPRTSVWFLSGRSCPNDVDCDGIPDATDCAPRSGMAGPGVVEVCDGWDNDCDGLADNGFDLDGDGVATCGGDCADDDPERFPGQIEICDGIDQDCDGWLDEQHAIYIDEDGDRSPIGCDCDDLDPSVQEAVEEQCGNGLDDDCDGEVDEPPCESDPDDGESTEPPRQSCSLQISQAPQPVAWALVGLVVGGRRRRGRPRPRNRLRSPLASRPQPKRPCGP